jgi:cyclophilin family peptidyl-prolyl cis-trans isomerase
MTGPTRIEFLTNGSLDLFLALHRELMGRAAWESALLPRPHTPEIARFREGTRLLRANGMDRIPGIVVTDFPPADLVARARIGWERTAMANIAAAMQAAAPTVTPALAAFEPIRAKAFRTLQECLPVDRIAPPLREALGVRDHPIALRLYLVCAAPYPPAVGFLGGDRARPRAYIDCRRYVGSTLMDGVVTLLAWTMLTSIPGPRNLSTVLAEGLPGDTPYHRKLRAILVKVVVETTAGHQIRTVDAAHRDCAAVLGSAWRFPRLHAAVQRHWGRYLDGTTDREEALASLVGEVSQYDPRWYVDRVDASALAADFYLMESLTALGDREAQARLRAWLPHLADELSQQLDLIIGTELGHYERARKEALSDRLLDFLPKVTRGDSRVAWWRTRREMGEAAALHLAVEAFGGPGEEFGGEAWEPIAAMLGRYLSGELPERVFVDQCFTLQHNNGCLFDKFYESDDLLTVLDAQAAGDMTALTRYASPEVRWRWRRHERRALSDYPAEWLALPVDDDAAEPPGADAWLDAPIRATLREARPGMMGCGSRTAPELLRADASLNRQEAVRMPFREVWRRRLPELRTFSEAWATLHTSAGDIRLDLWCDRAPYTVDNFLTLAEGRRTWTDPMTSVEHREPFYDGTIFHRRIPGFLIQGGDRTGTGECGPGYRIPDELLEEAIFDRPFLLAMANHGAGGAGSQFFVTLAPARHLDHEYALFGEVSDAGSRAVAIAVASAAEPVTLLRVSTGGRLAEVLPAINRSRRVLAVPHAEPAPRR